MEKERIERDFEGIVQHLRDDPSKKGTGGLETGIGVHLYQIDAKVFINHKVVSENLETMKTLISIKLSVHCSEGILNQFLKDITTRSILL